MVKNLRITTLATSFLLFNLLLIAGGGNGNNSGGGDPTAKKATTAALNLNWQEVGPNNLGTMGRAIVYDGNGHLYAGAMGGGLFKSTNAGASWNRVPGFADNLAVSSIAIDGNVICVGTGEKYFYQPSATYTPTWDYTQSYPYKYAYHTLFGRNGEGVFISTDGGVSFSNNNDTWPATSDRFTGKFSSIQKVAAKGGIILIGSLEGLYRSTDGLVSVNLVNGTNPIKNNPIVDIEFGNNNRVFVATADSVYISNDGGATFGAGINGLFNRDPEYPLMGSQRMAIAVSPTHPYVYITGASTSGNCSGVWKSTDNGDTWIANPVSPGEIGGTSTAFAPFRNLGRYNLVLEVSPDNPNYFYIGGDRLYRYTDTSGLAAVASNVYIPGFSTNYIPQTQMGMAFNPTNPSQYFVITDKEIVRTDNGGLTFTFKTKGFNAANTYNIHAAPNYKVIAGERFHGQIYKGHADTSVALQQFDPIYTRNGHAEFSLVDFNKVLSQAADGGLVRSLSNGDAWEQFYGTPADSMHPSLGLDSIFVNKADSDAAFGNLYDSGNQPFNPWALDEQFSANDLLDDTLIGAVPSYVFMCSRSFVWFVTNPFGGVDSLPKWTRVTKSITNKSASPREYFTAMAISGDANHNVYVATNYGKIYRIKNAHDPASMDVSTKFHIISDSSLPKRWITSMAIDPNNRNNLVVTYGAFDTTGNSRVYMTNNVNDTLVTWKSIGTGLNLMPVYKAAFHPLASIGALLLGTEDGVYSTTDDWNTLSNLTWNAENNTIGKVPVTDIFIRPYYMHVKSPGKFAYAPDYVTFISTLGRGIFKSQDLVAREEEKGGTNPAVEVDVKLYPNPSNGTAWIEHTLSERSNVTIEVYDINGSFVKTLANREFQAGTFILDLAGQNLNSGIYFVRSNIKNGKGVFNKTLKAIVLK